MPSPGVPSAKGWVGSSAEVFTWRAGAQTIWNGREDLSLSSPDALNGEMVMAITGYLQILH